MKKFYCCCVIAVSAGRKRFMLWPGWPWPESAYPVINRTLYGALDLAKIATVAVEQVCLTVAQ